MHRSLRLILGLMLSLAGLTLRAQTITTWTGTTSTDFFTGSNWTGGLPNFDGVTPFNVRGVIANGDTVTVASSNTIGTLVDVVTVGGGSALNVQAGKTFYLFAWRLGDSGTAGAGTVEGEVTAGFGFGVGVTGNGSLTVQNGGKLAGWVNVADVGTTGTLTLTGTNTELRYDSVADVSSSIQGGDGNASVTITAGASVDGPISLGGAGTSTLLISNGGTHTGGGIFLSATTGGSVTGHITDANTTVTPTAFSVGGTGTSTLLVDGGATVNSGAYLSEIGTAAGQAGTITVAGAGTSWSSAGGQILLGANGGTGILNFTTGATAAHADITIGRDTGSIGTLNVSGGAELTLTDSLRLGDNIGSGGGSGTLAISGGGSVSSDSGLLGPGSGGTGTVTITGAGSSWSAGNTFIVGGLGTGSVTVSNGGSLTNSSIATVGSSGGHGSVVVTGAGSSWTSASTVTVSTATSGSTGAITLTNGGTFTITSGLLRLSEGTGTGSLNIGAAANQAAAAPGDLVLGSGSVRSVGSNGTVVFNHTSNTYVFDDSLEFGVKVLQKSGVTTLAGPVTAFVYSGGTEIAGGTLKLGANNALGTGGITLSGGTLNLNDYDQVGSGGLTLAGNSYLDFSGVSALAVADSSALTWSGTLTLLNFDGSDSFRVGTTAGGLTPTQLGLIDVGGFMAQLDGSGYLSASSTPFTAVPEPSTYAAVAGLMAIGLAVWRRRQAPAVTLARRL